MQKNIRPIGESETGKIKKLIAVWTVRFEFSNRYMNLIMRFVWLAMFCKVFNMKPLGYAITVIASIVLFVIISWINDKFKLVHETQSAIWQRSPEYHKIMEEIKGIREDLKAERLRNSLGY